MKRELVFVLGLLISCQPAFSAAPTSVSDQVDASLVANGTASDYSEWKDSGTTPEDIVDRVAQQNTPAAWNELCRKFTSLSDENLALFDHVITQDENAGKLKCGAALERRLRAYWTKASRNLLIAHDGADASDGGPDDVSTSDMALPSEVRTIDATRGPVLFDGGLKHGEIALTFDDGPHPTRTQKILNTLKAAGIRATFFEVGEMAKRNPQLSRLEIAAGHTVGSHTWNHPQLPKLPLAAAEHNILLGHDTVMTATGVETPFFRFPYGARDKTLQSFVQGLKMASFFWNMDSLDWKLRNPTALFANVIKELDRAKGGIILFHDIQEQTTIVLPHFIEVLRERGYKTVVFVPTPPQPPLQ